MRLNGGCEYRGVGPVFAGGGAEEVAFGIHLGGGAGTGENDGYAIVEGDGEGGADNGGGVDFLTVAAIGDVAEFGFDEDGGAAVGAELFEFAHEAGAVMGNRVEVVVEAFAFEGDFRLVAGDGIITGGEGAGDGDDGVGETIGELFAGVDDDFHRRRFRRHG